MKSNVRRITDGAMIVAIMGLLTVLDGQSGMLLDGLLFWFIPIPIIIYVAKYNVSDGIIIAVSTTLLTFIISLPHLALLMGFSSLIGLAYGFGINKNLKTSSILTLTFIATLGYYLLSMIVFAAFFGYDPVAETQEIIKFFTQLLNRVSSSDINVITYLRWTNPFFAMLILFVPFLPIVISLLQTITTHLFSTIILNRLKLTDIKLRPVILMKISKPIGIVALITLFISYSYFIIGINGPDTVIMVLQFIAQLLFISMGAILMLTYVSIKGKILLAPLVGLFLIIFPIPVMIIGIADVFSNLRFDILRRSSVERESRTT